MSRDAAANAICARRSAVRGSDEWPRPEAHPLRTRRNPGDCAGRRSSVEGVPDTYACVLPDPPRDVVPADVVPPGRVGYDLTARQLLGHTFVSAAAYDELLGTGFLRAREDLVDPVDADAYRWMRQQMSTRLGNPGTVHPLWLWVKTTRRALGRVPQC